MESKLKFKRKWRETEFLLKIENLPSLGWYSSTLIWSMERQRQTKVRTRGQKKKRGNERMQQAKGDDGEETKKTKSADKRKRREKGNDRRRRRSRARRDFSHFRRRRRRGNPPASEFQEHRIRLERLEEKSVDCSLDDGGADGATAWEHSPKSPKK